MPLAPPPRWHTEVPGTRWFRADLHLHTLDDPYVDLPPGITGGRDSSAVLRAYAEAFLDAAVAQGIEVLGLTPHSATIAHGVSAAWAILETWLNEAQPSTGQPYRDLIYAVYPGFEPNFADGNKGIHLLFLFDPTIGKERYLNAFIAIMGGRPAYTGHKLNWTHKSPGEAFQAIDDAKVVGKGKYLVIAPHPLQDNGLLSRPDHYIANLAGGRIQAAELRHDKTLDEDLSESGKLRHAYKGKVAFHHASDAIRLPLAIPARERELGFRYALVKLAAPSLEALRQAFLAKNSRIRVPYARGDAGNLVWAADLPIPLPQGMGARPWIREVQVQGGTSFHRGQTFRFSPDLTCIIGGSMTGKSTLLDGLRLFLGGDRAMPDSTTSVGRQALERANGRFLSGGTTILVQSPAGDVSRPVGERFAVRFFSQGELKSLAEDSDGIEHLLFHLAPGRSAELLSQRDTLRELDARLWAAVQRLTGLQAQVAEAEQLFQRTAGARAAMERFAQAGTAELAPVQQDAARAKTFSSDVTLRVTRARELADEIATLTLPALNSPELRSRLTDPFEDCGAAEFLQTAQTQAASIVQTLEALQGIARALETAGTDRSAQVTAKVQAALVAAGGSAADLNEFEAFAKNAQHYDSFKAALDNKMAERDSAFATFTSDLGERDRLVETHRMAITTLCDEIHARFPERVAVVVDIEGRDDSLESWVQGFRTKGVTQWWNSNGKRTTTPTQLRPIATALTENRTPDALITAQAQGMSEAVARSFLEQIAPWQRQLEIWALRNPDRYRIRWIEGGESKDLEALSGGRRVAVLLALLLESDDPTPLFVDQPEDELDNRFLNETIIPALHRLKGKRQVVFATHNANLVVNGDADQVIALEADAQHGRVYACGAIEEHEVRNAIIRTLDGGDDAFRLRRAKYGF
ncbi:TrlF family AAA-like ATPase [uncultured Thiodictyon sp.]|uniref:TrlF family AAA-like ATPase n=1 Tax=uncultured Thiodictyon sp. TaxID=1846217 RepID=UPI0025E46A34|nr:AAA family ATPase [uncultured Thiodictyon sp.]